MITHERPNRKYEVGSGTAKPIFGRVDLVIPSGRTGNPSAWTLNSDNIVAVSFSNHAPKAPELLVLSLPRQSAEQLYAALVGRK